LLQRLFYFIAHETRPSAKQRSGAVQFLFSHPVHVGLCVNFLIHTLSGFCFCFICVFFCRWMPTFSINNSAYDCDLSSRERNAVNEHRTACTCAAPSGQNTRSVSWATCTETIMLNIRLYRMRKDVKFKNESVKSEDKLNAKNWWNYQAKINNIEVM